MQFLGRQSVSDQSAHPGAAGQPGDMWREVASAVLAPWLSSESHHDLKSPLETGRWGYGRDSLRSGTRVELDRGP